MANKKIVDFSSNTPTLTQKNIAEHPTSPNKFSVHTNQQLADLIISAIVTLGGSADYIMKVNSANNNLEGVSASDLIKFILTTNDNLIFRNSSGDIVEQTIKEILLSQVLTANDKVITRQSDAITQANFPLLYKTGFETTIPTPISSEMTIAAGETIDYSFDTMTKPFTVFVPGNTNGCLYSATFTNNKRYFTFLIYNASKDLDFYIDISPIGANLPSGWTIAFMLNTFHYATGIVVESLVNFLELQTFGNNGSPFPKDYISEISVTKSTTDFILGELECEINGQNIKNYGEITKDISGLSADTQYYVFVSSDDDEYPIFEVVTSETNAGTAYDNTRLLGFVYAPTAITNWVFSPIDNKISVANTAAYSILSTDKNISVTYTTTGTCAITILDAQNIAGRTLIISDDGGNATSNNITILNASASVLFTISTDSESISIFYNGTAWRQI